MRNLNTSILPSRARGKTITDDDALYNLDTPTKRALRNETRSLTHSRSFTNLAKSKQDAPRTPQKASTSYDVDGKSPIRPGGISLRRRSTLHWSTASPRARQQKLEDLAAHRLADTWFSIHSKNKHMAEPIYVSEVMEKSMNPSFAFFDLEHCEPLVTRVDDCILRLWAKDGTTDEYFMLVQVDVNLRSLQFIGKNLESFHHPLPQNCILLHLSDGIYTSFTDLPGDGYDPLPREHKAAPTELGSSFDALMQLANLDDCIQDAIKVRAELEEDVNEMLANSHPYRAVRRSLAAEKKQHSTAYNALLSLRKQKSQLDRRKGELRKALQLRREATRNVFSRDGQKRERCLAIEGKVQSQKETDQRIIDQTSGQIRRIGEDLLSIFPIEALKNKTLQFAICNLYLPNSSFDDTNRDEIAAALGFTAQLVHQLSLYLSSTLPYPIDANASNSFIRDPISMNLAQRRYPLHPTSVAYKFEYGVFLLNKDIEFLMDRVNLRGLDIRHTLPNLKYLLYVLTAGSGELPARKAGGIRGLLGGRLTPSVSRRGSEESVLGQKEILKRISSDSRRNGGVGPTSVSKEKAGAVDDPYAPPSKAAAGLSIRQSGLRDFTK